jgi:hypothetical protein
MPKEKRAIPMTVAVPAAIARARTGIRLRRAGGTSPGGRAIRLGVRVEVSR